MLTTDSPLACADAHIPARRTGIHARLYARGPHSRITAISPPLTVVPDRWRIFGRVCFAHNFNFPYSKSEFPIDMDRLLQDHAVDATGLHFVLISHLLKVVVSLRSNLSEIQRVMVGDGYPRCM